MNMYDYPTIDLMQLSSIHKMIQDVIDDPELLTPGVAPYDGDTLDMLRALSSTTPVTILQAKDKNPVGRPSNKIVLPVSEVEKELDELRQDITQLKIDAKGLETKERIDIIKARASLIEKVVGLKERIKNVKTQAKFITDVISIMEDLMEPEQQQKMIEQLKKYLEE